MEQGSSLAAGLEAGGFRAVDVLKEFPESQNFEQPPKPLRRFHIERSEEEARVQIPWATV